MIAIPTAPSFLPRAGLLALAVSIAAAGAARAQSTMAKDRATGASQVSVAQCREWLGTLAGPEFEGRGTGQPGFAKAANYVATHFKALGLEARGENGSYFQNVPWAETRIVPEKSFVRFSQNGGELLKIPADRLTGSASSSLSVKGDAVLLAIDVPAPAPRQQGQGRNSMAMPAISGLDDVDVKGKVVVVHLRQTGERPNPMGQFAVLQALQGKEAAAILFAQTAEARGGMSGRRGMGRRPGSNPAASGAQRSPAQAAFGGKDLEKLLGGIGMTIESLAKAPTVTALPLQAEVEITAEETNAPAMNVWAVLPGSDPKRKDEYVVIGSHLDHLGKSGDTIRPGADDDGSGTTGVMAVAQMLAKNPVRPARSILFVCFSGEESGLVGSRFFADNCPIPLSSIVGELQMDMIGRDEEENVEGNKGEKAEDNRNSLHLVGTQKLAPSLHEICLQKNEVAKFDIEYDQEGMFGRSDHANFARHGVPVAFFFTGLHSDYHQPSDTPDKIHYEKLLRVATYVYDVAFELASQPGRPEIEPKLWQEFRASNRNTPPETPAAPLKPAAPAGK